MLFHRTPRLLFTCTQRNVFRQTSAVGCGPTGKSTRILGAKVVCPLLPPFAPDLGQYYGAALGPGGSEAKWLLADEHSEDQEAGG
jgi:hypothetical protein